MTKYSDDKKPCSGRAGEQGDAVPQFPALSEA